MTFSERRDIKTRIRKLNGEIKWEKKKLFQDQNHEKMNRQAAEVKSLERQLIDADSKKKISKEQFRDEFKKEFNMPEPQDIVEINTIAELDAAWPLIMSGRVMIAGGSQEIYDETKKRMKDIAQKTKVDGFR